MFAVSVVETLSLSFCGISIVVYRMRSTAIAGTTVIAVDCCTFGGRRSTVVGTLIGDQLVADMIVGIAAVVDMFDRMSGDRTSVGPVGSYRMVCLPWQRHQFVA